MIKNLKQKYPKYDRGKKAADDEEKKKKETEVEKKKILEAKIRKQVACEEKAFRIVERLIENPISEEFLLDACQFIAPHHYDDIVEERAITKTCGYPICNNPLTSVSKQKYHISTRENKVYDISERKNFCSNQCYKASRYLQQQISTSPLWSRNDERIKITLLSANRGLPGIEVVGPIENVRKEVHQLEKLNKLGSKVTERSQNVNKEIEDSAIRISAVSLKDENRKTTSEIDSDDENDMVQEKAQNYENKLTEKNSKNETVAEQNGKFIDNLSKGDNSQRQSKSEDTMQHLMKLLDRRKQLLGQLAEIETVSEPVTEHEQSKGQGSSKSCENVSNQHLLEMKTAEIMPCEVQNVDTGLKSRKSETDSENLISTTTKTEQKFCVQGENMDEQSSPTTKTDTSKVSPQQSKSRTDTESDKDFSQQSLPRTSTETHKVSTHTVIQMICHSIKSWITPATIEFLQTTPEQGYTSPNRARADFEAMYQALCRRVDAGEFEIEDIGMESKMGDGRVMHEKTPGFEQLKEETNKFAKNVQKFYAGELFPEPVEKEEKDKTPVYLPTVDSYDQMQIRRKIVMERLQKVISDVLSPLKLTIQDIYTEYKELVATFRLDSKNILHKPAEWTIINLIILRMLSRKIEKVKRAFLQPSSVAYFKILLGKLGTNLQQIDIFIDDVLLNH